MIMTYNEFCTEYFRIKDSADKILRILDSLIFMDHDIAVKAFADIYRFINNWKVREANRYRGYFWEIRKKVLSDELRSRVSDIDSKISEIVYKINI